MMNVVPSAVDLQRLQYVWPVDHYADELIDKIFESHTVDSVSALLRRFIDYRELHHALDEKALGISNDLMQEIRAYFDFYVDTHLPDWADKRKIESAIEMFQEHQYTCYTILLCASLPECYLCRDGSRVLAATHRLSDDVHRRLLETQDFMATVMTPGNLISDNAPGIIAAKKTRLIHAAIRHLIRSEAEKPDPGSASHVADRVVHGGDDSKSPIDQCLLALALQTFCYVVLRSLNVIGVSLSSAQQDAYVHTWSVLGYFMGISDHLLPQNVDQAESLFALLKAQQRGETEAGKELEQGLLAFTERMLPWYLREVPRHLTQDLMDPEDWALLGLKSPSLIGRLRMRVPLRIAQSLNRKHRLPLAGEAYLPHACEYLARALIVGFSKLEDIDGRRVLEIPDQLTKLPPVDTSSRRAGLR